MPDPVAVLRPIEVDADLVVRVTAPTGESTTAHVSGNGSAVRVDAADPTVLFAAVAPSDVGRMAELLAASGLVVNVTGPHGAVATVGAGVSNRVGKAVTGSSRVAPAPRAALRIAAGTRAARVLAAALPVLLVVGGILIRRPWRS